MSPTLNHNHVHGLPPAHPPVTTLRLSHPSFLDAVLTADNAPAYTLETEAHSTVLYRCQADGLSQVAEVTWPHENKHYPRDKPSVLVHMNDKSYTEAEFLRTSSNVLNPFVHPSQFCDPSLSLNSSRKFALPGQSRSLKWRRLQGVYECTFHGMSSPIAHYEPANLTSSSKLKIYASSLPGMSLDNKYVGVDQTLLEHLIVTCLLLVTSKDEWRHMGSSSPVSSTESPVTPISANPRSEDSWYRSPGGYASYTPSIASTRSNYTQRPRATAPVLCHPTPPLRRCTSSYTGIRSSSFASSPYSPVSTASAAPSISSYTPSLRTDLPPLPIDIPQSMSPVEISPSEAISAPRSQTSRSSMTLSQSSSTSQYHSHSHVQLSPPPAFRALPTPPSSFTALPQYDTMYNGLNIHGVVPVIKEDGVNDGEMPPPYNEIEWTVRLKTPRGPGFASESRGGRREMRRMRSSVAL
ncbi:hypothetical protein SISNIDRAFT_492553 [Sistotremastrum niveocremeum HHB9708]|uniref:Uncharacterized protein n=1 Tax=Sistotremastrum niveocremeum HHB9708 TaxID=1314777 RepID=A0A164ZW42_9AGAM|nr:hypothetical protein SISNIDRAFT_492553 [Sistotremastrum niveocremeum HHB9708]